MELRPRAARAPGAPTIRHLCVSCCPSPRTMCGEPMRRDRPRQRQFSRTVARVQLALRGRVCAAAQCSPSSRPLLRGIVVAAQPVVGRRRAAEATASVANE